MRTFSRTRWSASQRLSALNEVENDLAEMKLALDAAVAGLKNDLLKRTDHA